MKDVWPVYWLQLQRCGLFIGYSEGGVAYLSVVTIKEVCVKKNPKKKPPNNRPNDLWKIILYFGIKYKWSAVQWYDRQQRMVIIYANDE